MSKKKVTMQMIADKLGITKVSVSKALNNQPGISDELKKRILATSHELGYIKNKGSMSSHEVKRLGFMVSKRFFIEGENFYTVIYYNLNKECALKNINLSLYIVDPDDEKELTLPFSIQQDNLDGLFLAGEFSETYIHAVLQLINIPTVAIDFYKTHMTIDCVIIDNFYASFIATMYLIDKGHKNIGFVGNPASTSSIMDRFYGYLKALNYSGLEYHKEWHLNINESPEVYDYGYQLRESLPTAFICHCDMAAYRLMLKLQSQRVSIPNLLSLVSFDNTELSKNCNPSLTTVDINKKEIASKALKQILWRIDNISAEPQRVYVSTHLIERNSVSKAF